MDGLTPEVHITWLMVQVVPSEPTPLSAILYNIYGTLVVPLPPLIVVSLRVAIVTVLVRHHSSELPPTTMATADQPIDHYGKKGWTAIVKIVTKDFKQRKHQGIPGHCA